MAIDKKFMINQQIKKEKILHQIRTMRVNPFRESDNEKKNSKTIWKILRRKGKTSWRSVSSTLGF
jgi:hypothetical protein